MNIHDNRFRNLPIFSALLIVLAKLPFLLTHHIQEDAFITWRVAQNLLDYGVIGFNGDTKISASTTHLYMIVSAFFNWIFGRENFIYPLLIFNSIAFTAGSFLLSKMVLKSPFLQGIFIILLGILPPSIKISILGMEYGLLFLLEMSVLYFGIYQQKNWATIVLPIFILFTRIDTVIFLGIIFLIDSIYRKKINWSLFLGSAIGVIAVVGFNGLYFHEIVNNTIVAKQLRYDQDYTLQTSFQLFLQNLGNFWGMLKLPGNYNPFTILVLIFEWFCFISLMRSSTFQCKKILLIIFVFGWVKQFIFLSQKSYFDWYYWVPQILLFVPVLLFVLQQKKFRYGWLSLLFVCYLLPMLGFQVIHSIATGNGEWNYRRIIGIYLDQHEKDKNQWILLEPAGFIPYYSKLKTIDEVGLVDKAIQLEIKKDKKNYWINTVKHRKPKYLLSYQDLFVGENAAYYQSHYVLLKKFRIADHLSSKYPILEKIYRLKPSGTDYNLYVQKK